MTASQIAHLAFSDQLSQPSTSFTLVLPPLVRLLQTHSGLSSLPRSMAAVQLRSQWLVRDGWLLGSSLLRSGLRFLLKV